jgi:hypothetical protein
MQNLGAIQVEVTPQDYEEIDREVPPGSIAGDRYGPEQMAMLDSEKVRSPGSRRTYRAAINGDIASMRPTGLMGPMAPLISPISRVGPIRIRPHAAHHPAILDVPDP